MVSQTCWVITAGRPETPAGMLLPQPGAWRALPAGCQQKGDETAAVRICLLLVRGAEGRGSKSAQQGDGPAFWVSQFARARLNA